MRNSKPRKWASVLAAVLPYDILWSEKTQYSAFYKSFVVVVDKGIDDPKSGQDGYVRVQKLDTWRKINNNRAFPELDTRWVLSKRE